MKRPQKWVQGHGGSGSYSYFKDMTDDEIRIQGAARRSQMKRLLDAAIWKTSGTGITKSGSANRISHRRPVQTSSSLNHATYLLAIPATSTRPLSTR